MPGEVYEEREGWGHRAHVQQLGRSASPPVPARCWLAACPYARRRASTEATLQQAGKTRGAPLPSVRMRPRADANLPNPSSTSAWLGALYTHTNRHTSAWRPACPEPRGHFAIHDACIHVRADGCGTGLPRSDRPNHSVVLVAVHGVQPSVARPALTRYPGRLPRCATLSVSCPVPMLCAGVPQRDTQWPVGGH